MCANDGYFEYMVVYLATVVSPEETIDSMLQQDPAFNLKSVGKVSYPLPCDCFYYKDEKFRYRSRNTWIKVSIVKVLISERYVR